jgi:uncharacterized protein YkwD
MRGSGAFLSWLIGLAVLVGLPCASAAHHRQQQQNVFVGQGKIARRGGPDAGKAESTAPESRSSASSPSDSHAETRAEAPPGHTIDEIEELEIACLDEVNHQRVVRGLTPMEVDWDLLAVARGYSRQMAEEGFFSHTDRQGCDVRRRLDKARISWLMVGENLSYSNGYVNPVAAALRGWMNSPGHRRNILEGRYNDSAIGAWIAADGTIYFTQIFLRK